MIGVDISEWRPAPMSVNGEQLCVVGDIHGCADQLAAWLDACESLRVDATGDDRLIFLGDIINRGPDTDRAIRLWNDPLPVRKFARVHRLMGNHEQLEWIENRPRARLWDNLEPGVCVGNIVFVHAGVDPYMPLDEFLAIPKHVVPADKRHWAWIEGPFVTWTSGFGGRMIVHGHTPPAKHRAWTGIADPHVLNDAKLCVDGGSAVTGTVTGAQIENGRYRIIRACLTDAIHAPNRTWRKT